MTEAISINRYNLLTVIMKSIIAAGALCALSSPAFAGPYANVENNAAWLGTDLEAGITEVHAGYEFEAGEDVLIYVQAGPAFVYVEDVDTQTEVSGKVGISADLNEDFNLYGEVSFITADQEFNSDDLALGTKVGAIYRF